MNLSYTNIEELHTSFSVVPLKSFSILEAAVNINRFQKFLDDLTVAKKKLIENHNPGKEFISPDHENWNEFLVEWNNLRQKEVDVGDVKKIRKEDLNLDREVNNANVQVAVANLLKFDLLEDKEEKKEKA